MPQEDLLIDCLNQQPNAVHAALNQALANRYPDAHVLLTDNHYFLPHHCEDAPWTFGTDLGQWEQRETGWHVKQDRGYDSPKQGWYRAKWKDTDFLLLLVATKGAYRDDTAWYVIGPSESENRDFFATVCRHHSVVRGEILVYQEGCWSNDKELFEAVHSSRLEDLVLHGGLKEEIVRDIELFLGQEETYSRYRVAWKRGMLFLGPPGNGKTHLIRALAAHFPLPCLYVKSFEGQHRTPQACVAGAFERAREVGSCFLILEDLDTLLTSKTRSFFLNEMDGFASNHGIVTIATCNFPEKLDPAITERPSRFDRKYHFNLPEVEDRRRFIERFQERFEGELRLAGADLDRVAEGSEGYSYAYLKELLVASAMRWISDGGGTPYADVVLQQSISLRQQMTTEWTAMRQAPHPPSKPAWDDDDE